MQSTVTQTTDTSATKALKGYDVLRYTLDDFDKSFCLRPPWTLLVCMLFLARDFVLPVGAAATSLSGGAADMAWVLQIRQPFWYLLQLPVLLLMYSWIRRTPSGDAVARWTWTHGFALLTATIGAQVFAEVTSAPVLLSDPGAVAPGTLILLAGLLACGVFLALSQRARNALSDFPEHEPAK